MLNNTNKFAGCILMVVAVGCVTVSHAAADRTAISTQRIVDAMAVAGIAASPNQIEVLSGASSATLSAAMRVVSVSHGTASTVGGTLAGALKVKLRCQDNHQCLPFYVLVHGVDGAKARGMRVDSMATAVATPLGNVVRSGDHAVLTVETADFRMSFPVICLQGGARGQKVRVTSPDRKRFFDAEVVAAGVLKGSL